jgi:Xaa-Pro aminopeptidase
MPIDVLAIQHALREDGLDGWLWFDFRGSNPIARKLAGLEGSGKMTTRRWYYLVPADGEPRGLVHAIERFNLDHLPGRVDTYSGRESLSGGLDALLAGCRRIAMEYSAGCAIPYLSRVDAGTIEAVRERGVTVVGSGDLVQRFEARWSDEQVAMHQQASASLYRIKDQTFAEAARRLRDGVATTELDLQQLMLQWFAEEGLVADSTPNVSAQENAGNPHYHPSASQFRAVDRDEVLLLDLWGKLDRPGSVYADITWVAFTGRDIPAEVTRAFDTVVRARDAAIALAQRATRAGEDLRGWQVDRAAREIMEAAGYGKEIWHRTGHSLGQEVHGNGANMDDYETHDDRRVLAGTGFTIEPGLYFDTFGVRTEIDVVVKERDAVVSGPLQERLLPLVP